MPARWHRRRQQAPSIPARLNDNDARVGTAVETGRQEHCPADRTRDRSGQIPAPEHEDPARHGHEQRPECESKRMVRRVAVSTTRSPRRSAMMADNESNRKTYAGQLRAELLPVESSTPIAGRGEHHRPEHGIDRGRIRVPNTAGEDTSQHHRKGIRTRSPCATLC
jgi:hypothetical protein